LFFPGGDRGSGIVGHPAGKWNVMRRVPPRSALPRLAARATGCRCFSYTSGIRYTPRRFPGLP